MRLLAALALLAASPLPAAGHVRLVSPLSRYGDEMKFGPCGRLGGARSANVTTYPPGATVTVVFDEIIAHPGHYRIAFDPGGDDFYFQCADLRLVTGAPTPTPPPPPPPPAAPSHGGCGLPGAGLAAVAAPLLLGRRVGRRR